LGKFVIWEKPPIKRKLLKNRVIAVSAWLRQAGQGWLLFMPRYNVARPDARDLIAYL